MLKSINWTQWGIAICGLLVIIFVFIDKGLETKENNRIREENLKLSNQAIALTKKNIELTETIRDLTKDNNEVSKRIEHATITGLKKGRAPDLRISSINASLEKNSLTIIVKNYGKSTAEDINVDFNPTYATQTISDARELPANSEQYFHTQIFPLLEHEGMQKAYEDIINDFRDERKVLVIHLFINWTFESEPYQSKEYTLIIRKNSITLT